MDACMKSVLIVFTFSYFLVLNHCQSVPVRICGSGAPGYDVGNLTSRVWSFVGNTQNCLAVNETIPSLCMFYMGICLDINISPICSSSSVCQASENNSTFYKLAEYKPEPFQMYIVPPGFKAVFGPGEVINNTGTGGKTCQLTTQINFECNTNKIWPIDTESNLVPYPPTISYNPATCAYNITFEYNGACLQILPSNPVMQLSGGTVLIIIFVVTVTIYFTFGSMLNIARGKHGKDLIPNNNFWMTLPVYIAEGIVFTLQCGRVPAKEYESIS